MAFLHCHACGWEQDDFWDKDGYNPFKSIQDWKDSLFKGNLDELFTTDPYFNKEHGSPTNREILAKEFENRAKAIRNMVYITEEEFRQKNPERNCPKCGKHELDID